MQIMSGSPSLLPVSSLSPLRFGFKFQRTCQPMRREEGAEESQSEERSREERRQVWGGGNGDSAHGGEMLVCVRLQKRAHHHVRQQ